MPVMYRYRNKSVEPYKYLAAGMAMREFREGRGLRLPASAEPGRPDCGGTVP
ncbi:hypothetical protein SAMN02799616_01684, partial [Paenibacillus sp. UNC499MF]